MPRIGGNARAYREDRWDSDPPKNARNDIVVDLDDYREVKPPTFEMKDGKAVEAEDDEPRNDPKQGEFNRNLALDYDESQLDSWASEIVELVEQDITERQPARDRFERGLAQMGLVESDIDDGPFPGAANAVHPLLIEAITQFWARAMGELFPPEGPFKCKVEGSQQGPELDRADRVADYMNYEAKFLDKGYIHEKSKLVWDTPNRGSTFSKTFRDPVRNINCTIYVSADDLIVPAEGSSLETTPRFTHRMKKFPNEVKQLMVAQYYRDVDLEMPGDEEYDETEALKHEVEDVQPDGDDYSNRHEILEVCIDRSLPGDEHEDMDGEETGLERSYYFTIDRQSRKILSIYRGWREDDPLCMRRVQFAHYKFVPGPGFYGLGLFHLIGGLQVAATGALRVLLDSAASASLSGGFVSKHANLKGKRLVLTPGHWETVDATGEDLQKAFFTPPVKDPSPALFQLIGFLTERGEKFTATTELMTGDSDPKNAPVGTTSQMIEQGGKVMSTIHRMMVETLGGETTQRYELNQEYAPPEGYPYEVAGQQRTVYADDFAPGVQIVPIADPNIASSAQRIQIYQAAIQMAMQTGQGNLKVLVKRFFKAIKLDDVDEIIEDDEEPQAYDPVGEIQAMMMGKAIKVMPQQPHQMHLQVLWAFASNPQYGGNPQIQKQVGPTLLSVIGQHLAYAFATSARGLGVPVGYMDPASGQVQNQGTPEQIATMLAQIAPQLMSIPGLPPVQEQGKDGDAQAKLQIMQQELQMKKEAQQQELAHDKEKHQWEMQRDQQKAEHEKQMGQIKADTAVQTAQVNAQVKQAEGQIKLQTAQNDAQMQQRQAEHQMAIDTQQAHQQQQMDQQQMHMEGQNAQVKMQHEQQMGAQKMQHAEAQNQQKLQHGAQQQAQQSAGMQAQPDKLQHLRLKAPPHGGGMDQGM